MSNVLTLFRDLSTDRGDFQQREILCGKDKYCLYVYSRLGSLNLDFINEVSIENINNHDYILSSLRKSGGGWVVDSVNYDEESFKIRIYIIYGQGFSGGDSPIKCYCLQPDTDTIQPCALNDKNPSSGIPVFERILPQGSHIILPIDKAAEDRFLQFRSDWLNWFPNDFELNVLSLLRQPSMSLRIERLERLLEGKMVELGVLEKAKIPSVEPGSVENSSPAIAVSADKETPSLIGKLKLFIQAAYKPYLLGFAVAAIIVAVLFKLQILPLVSTTAETRFLILKRQNKTGQATPDKVLLADLHKIVDHNKPMQIANLWNSHFSGETGDEINFSTSVCQSDPKVCWGLIKLPLVLILKQDKNLLKKDQDNNLQSMLENEKFFDSSNDTEATLKAYNTALSSTNKDQHFNLTTPEMGCYLSFLLSQLEPTQNGITNKFKTDLNTIVWTSCPETQKGMIDEYKMLMNGIKTSMLSNNQRKHDYRH